MYRRIFFVALVPLLGRNAHAEASGAEIRSLVGFLGATAAIALLRETAPFISASTNDLLVLASHSIALTYLGAFVVVSESVTRIGLDRFVLGMCLALVNASYVIFVLWVCYLREQSRKKMHEIYGTEKTDIGGVVQASMHAALSLVSGPSLAATSAETEMVNMEKEANKNQVAFENRKSEHRISAAQMYRTSKGPKTNGRHDLRVSSSGPGAPSAAPALPPSGEVAIVVADANDI